MDGSTPPKLLLDIAPSLFTAGFRLVDAGEIQALFQALVGSQVGLAATGTTAATALGLKNVATNVVATTPSGTGVRLPHALVGSRITVANNGANALLIYPNPPDQIIPVGSATPAVTPVSAATLTVHTFVCTTVGIWQQVA
jgi:hypothetical protein